MHGSGSILLVISIYFLASKFFRDDQLRQRQEQARVLCTVQLSHLINIAQQEFGGHV
jgi:hypothetical protein